jgi:hypothetical protein
MCALSLTIEVHPAVDHKTSEPTGSTIPQSLPLHADELIK